MDYKEFCEWIRQCYIDKDRRALYDEITKPMGVEEIKALLLKTDGQDRDALSLNYQQLAEFIQPLTRQQGFVVDWRKAPDWTTHVSLVWTDLASEAECFESIPRPTPKCREMTVEEMIVALVSVHKYTSETLNLKWIATEMAKGRTLTDLCAAAGIQTKIEVTE